MSYVMVIYTTGIDPLAINNFKLLHDQNMYNNWYQDFAVVAQSFSQTPKHPLEQCPQCMMRYHPDTGNL